MTTGLPVVGLNAPFFLAGIQDGVDRPGSQPLLTNFAGHTQRHTAGTYSFLLRPSSGEGEAGIFPTDVLLLVISIRGGGHQAQTTCVAKYDRDGDWPSLNAPRRPPVGVSRGTLLVEIVTWVTLEICQF